MKQATLETIDLGGRKVDYHLVQSKTAQKLKVRVGLSGVEVVQPLKRDTQELEAFLEHNQGWIINQLDRAERLSSIRKPLKTTAGEILFRGIPTPIQVEENFQRKGTNKVVFENGTLTILLGVKSHTSPIKSLENWLRRQAKQEISRFLETLTQKLGKSPNKVYVMAQKTKWGNCSSLSNLSFNWRLIMAPDFVLKYLVTHEAVHLVVPDHSKRFWLTVQSLCPEMERAKQWLCANSDRLMTDMR
ncbi:M48 family metallopeptidase [Altericista sp. CCNU0014]|uniref:M48 family metallopeptidase n=1 Tax=Altericista sp. CCNU0014 TaxID=3082949 RepID=UPI00384A89A4